MFVSMLGAMTILPVLIVRFDPKFIHGEKERVIASRRPDPGATRSRRRLCVSTMI
jgi:hypothetical protein